VGWRGGSDCLVVLREARSLLGENCSRCLIFTLCCVMRGKNRLGRKRCSFTLTVRIPVLIQLIVGLSSEITLCEESGTLKVLDREGSMSEHTRLCLMR
jgi:hypothetical protein